MARSKQSGFHQVSLFDMDNEVVETNIDDYRLPIKKVEIDENCFNKLKKYKLEDYISDVETLGLETTWDLICEFVISNYSTNKFLTIDKFGEHYEIGLAIQDKQQKKIMHNYIIGAYNAGRALDALMGLKELDENGRKVARILLQLCYDDENKAGLISVLRGSHLKGYKSNARKMMFVVDFFENGPTLE